MIDRLQQKRLYVIQGIRAMTDDYLTRLESERDRINQQIEELKRKQNHLQELIRHEMATRYLKEEAFKITKKNQTEIYFWAIIRQMLLHEQTTENKGLKSREIYDRLVTHHENIKYSTLRSYLHRFSKDTRIEKDHISRTWKLTETIYEK